MITVIIYNKFGVKLQLSPSRLEYFDKDKINNWRFNDFRGRSLVQKKDDYSIIFAPETTEEARQMREHYLFWRLST